MRNPKENPNPRARLDSPPGEQEEREQPASEVYPCPPFLRRPFTSLSQVDADLALARTLQEQERAYLMLRMGAMDGSDYATWNDGSEYGDYLIDDHGSMDESDYDDDEFDGHDHGSDIDSEEFRMDEACARQVQEAEDWEEAIRLMSLARINDYDLAGIGEDREVHGSQDAWLEVDPDDLQYEELVALGEAVGTESRGLSADTVASLPSVSYKPQSAEDGNSDKCVICRVDYEDGDSLVFLTCKHTYHPECINKWLQMNKVCPICSAEVSTSQNS